MNNQFQTQHLRNTKVQETSATGGGTTGGAAFTPGAGEQYATTKILKKKVKEDAPMLAHGKADISTYTQDNFKKVEGHANLKSIEPKDLWGTLPTAMSEELEEIISRKTKEKLDGVLQRVKDSSPKIYDYILDLIADIYPHDDEVEALVAKASIQEIEEEGSPHIPDNIAKFAQRKGVTDVVNQVAHWAEKYGKRIVGGTAIGKNYSTLILDLTHQGGEVRINTDTDEIEINDQDVVDYESFADAIDSLTDSLNENYHRFKRQTKERSKQDQYHEAIKAINKKLDEVNRILEFTSRMKEELSEGDGVLEMKSRTAKTLNKTKTKVAEAYKKLKHLD